jgi:hypothetical protein
MNTSVAKEMIRVIRAERESRLARLPTEDPDFAYDEWLSTDEPFINDLCLTLLVALWHQVERELVHLAARVTSDGRELSLEQYWQRINKERQQLDKHGWEKTITVKLKLNNIDEWSRSMTTLRLLANSYKHHPSTKPKDLLLQHLAPITRPNLDYDSLPESQGFKAELAASLDLRDGANYCDIADELLARVDRFLAEVPKQSMLSPVKWRVLLPHLR